MDDLFTTLKAAAFITAAVFLFTVDGVAEQPLWQTVYENLGILVIIFVSMFAAIGSAIWFTSR